MAWLVLTARRENEATRVSVDLGGIVALLVRPVPLVPLVPMALTA